MLKKKKVLIIGLVLTLTVLLLISTGESQAKVFYGKVVGTEVAVIQVRGDNGKVSTFWMGHRTHLESRLPFFGNKVRIEFVKDKLGRNAVTRIKVLVSNDTSPISNFKRAS